MDIKPYLLELIATRKTVGINALGTLYKKKIPGRYDSETHSFLPPKHTIAFTNEITDDTSLAIFISEKKNISLESANYYVNEFVEGIQSQLADHHYADFSPLGELKSIDGEIIFESSKTIDNSFDFYGLPSVSATIEENLSAVQEPEINIDGQALEIKEEINEQELKAKEDPQEIEEKEEEAIETKPNSESERDNQPVYDEIADVNSIQEQNELEERIDIEPNLEEPDTEKESSILDPSWRPTVLHRYEYDDEDEDENSGNWMRKLLKVTFVLVVIVSLAVALVYYFYPDLFYTIKGNFSEQPIEESEPILNIDSSSKIDSPVADSLKIASVLPPVAVKDSLTAKKLNKTVVYEVIGSAMKTQKKADEVILILSKRGINAKKVDAMPGRRIKISLGTFTDFSLAKKFQDSLRIKLRNPEIYIQTIKPEN
ncbi:MAG: hypothetical protein V4663_18405 [Bacteroidota bacterium]